MRTRSWGIGNSHGWRRNAPVSDPWGPGNCSESAGADVQASSARMPATDAETMRLIAALRPVGGRLSSRDAQMSEARSDLVERGDDLARAVQREIHARLAGALLQDRGIA